MRFFFKFCFVFLLIFTYIYPVHSCVGVDGWTLIKFNYLTDFFLLAFGPIIVCHESSNWHKWYRAVQWKILLRTHSIAPEYFFSDLIWNLFFYHHHHHILLCIKNVNIIVNRSTIQNAHDERRNDVLKKVYEQTIHHFLWL